MTKQEFQRTARDLVNGLHMDVVGNRALANNIRPFDPVLAGKVDTAVNVFEDIQTYLKTHLEVKKP